MGKFTTKHITVNTSKKKFKALIIFIKNSQAYWDESVNIPDQPTNKDNLEKPIKNWRVQSASSRNDTANKESLS